jgi:hypothetical protein
LQKKGGEGEIRKCARDTAGDQGTYRRDKEICERHMQEIREHEGEIRKCARDTCRKSGTKKEM